MFSAIEPTAAERAEDRPGDALVAPAAVVMDRAFDVPGTPDQVWPWLAQLGKRRAGWYLPRAVEQVIPRTRRGLRTLEPRWQNLVVGQDIPDYGGRDEIFTVDEIDPPRMLVYRSQRRAVQVSWSIVLRPLGGSSIGNDVEVASDELDRPGSTPRTRVLLRLRLGPLKRVWLARTGGELIDAVTVAGLAAGLRERLGDAGS